MVITCVKVRFCVIFGKKYIIWSYEYKFTYILYFIFYICKIITLITTN